MNADPLNFRQTLHWLEQIALALPSGTRFTLPSLVPPPLWPTLPSHEALGRRFRQIADPDALEWIDKDERGIAVYLRK